MSEAAPKPWVTNRPEQRLQIAFMRLLTDTLCLPRYYVANMDADSGGRSDLQRIRDSNRGIYSGQLDVEVEQGPPHLFRRVELKRGKNKPTPHQLHTIERCTACGAPPIVAWTLAQAILGLGNAGFRFETTLNVRLAFWQAQLEAWDREAELTLAGVAKPKRSRNAAPVRQMTVAAYRRAHAKGLV